MTVDLVFLDGEVRWNPDSEDDVYLLQSAHLWTRYHELQINLHRPFIPSHSDTPKEAVAEIGFPSLSICLSASRAIVRIIECVHRRFPDRLFPLFSVGPRELPILVRDVNEILNRTRHFWQE